MHCIQCGTDLGLVARFCPSCGTEGGTSATPEQNTTAEYAAFIGTSGQAYYLRKFAQFDAAGGAGASWNWPSFFVAFYWMLYRKMWLNALAYFLAPYLLMFVVGMIGGLSGTGGSGAAGMLGAGWLLYTAVIFFVFPIYADALYYRHCKKKIAEISNAQPPQQRMAQIAAAGGTSNIALIVALILIFVFGIGILAAVAIPAYQDYMNRAQTAEAFAVGQQATAAVGSFYVEHHGLPENLEAAGLNIKLPPAVKSVSLNTGNGVIAVTMATGILADKSLEMVPSENEDHSLNWSCQSEDIPAKALPKACQQ